MLVNKGTRLLMWKLFLHIVFLILERRISRTKKTCNRWTSVKWCCKDFFLRCVPLFPFAGWYLNFNSTDISELFIYFKPSSVSVPTQTSGPARADAGTSWIDQMGAGQPGEANWVYESWAGWEKHWTVIGWVQTQRSGDQLRNLRVAKTRLVTLCAPGPVGWKSFPSSPGMPWIFSQEN